MSIAANLVRLRKAQTLTQYALAERKRPPTAPSYVS